MRKDEKEDSLKSISESCREAESLLESLEEEDSKSVARQSALDPKEQNVQNSDPILKSASIPLFIFGSFALVCALIILALIPYLKTSEPKTNIASTQDTNGSSAQKINTPENKNSPETQQIRIGSAKIKPEPPRRPANPGLSQQQAKQIVEKWLNVKSEIFAPPFNRDLADQVVAYGPLWSDLTKPDGSIQWLIKNNSYYTYSMIRINRVIEYQPSPSTPSITVSVTETSNLHSPRGTETKTNTANWLYTLKKESGSWKILDYRKKQ